MDHLALPNVYRHADGLVHTSSHGQKFEVAVNSLHARYSCKYFGQDQRVSAYTFIDMRHFLPYSLIISAAEHEAHYVIDGLMHNDVVKSDIHSTDTGGFTVILTLMGYTRLPDRGERD
jgi:TnpA family transposase